MLKWGLITDTHDRVELSEAAIHLFMSERCARVFHCGDFTSDSILELFLGKQFAFHFVTDHYSHDSSMENKRSFSVIQLTASWSA